MMGQHQADGTVKLLNDFQVAYGLGKKVGRYDAPGVRKFFRDAAGAHGGWPDPNSKRQYELQMYFFPGVGLVTERPHCIGGTRNFEFRGWNRHTLKRGGSEFHLRVRTALDALGHAMAMEKWFVDETMEHLSRWPNRAVGRVMRVLIRAEARAK